MPKLARDHAQVDAFERAFGVRLPEDYRDFLLRTESGVRLGAYDLDGQHREILEVYAFDAPLPIHDLAARRVALRGLVAQPLQPFARDSDGGLLCVGVLNDLHAGAVYLVRVPRPRQTPVPPRLIAATFSQFLDGLVLALDDATTATAPPRRPRSRRTTNLRKP